MFLTPFFVDVPILIILPTIVYSDDFSYIRDQTQLNVLVVFSSHYSNGANDKMRPHQRTTTTTPKNKLSRRPLCVFATAADTTDKRSNHLLARK